VRHGLSFAPIVAAIGPSGRLTGVELSPEMAGLARERVAREGWRNVRVDESGHGVRASRRSVRRGACSTFTHDVLRTPGALENIFGACKPGARVAVAGSKLLPWWLAPLNGWVRRINAPYMTTFDGLERPWAPLERHVPGLKRESALGGIAYVAWGRAQAPRA
jgi:demethylmenaquinone methyltransferase/2-methoxy-6-polyprenyl-1,4-benzoquinol methylase